jgi:hypothetical protein
LEIESIRVDFACIAKEAFITTKNIVISNVNDSIVNLDLVSTKAKAIIALTSSLKTFFTYNFVKMLKSTAR